MGDIRNKLMKIERAKRERAAFDGWLRAYAKANPSSPMGGTMENRCLCGHDWQQAQVVAIQTADWPHETLYFCPVCVPDEYREDMESALRLNM